MQAKKFTLFRYPMAHSFSDLIHQSFARECQLSVEYTVTEAKPGTLKQQVEIFRKQGGMGANVTIPLKEEAYSICDQLTSRAKHSQSVNTLFWKGDVLWGDNTDGIGLIRDITQNLNYSLKDKVVCILGAGGAAAGIIEPIEAQKSKSILICNRTLSRAQLLVDRFKELEVTPKILSTEDHVDWIINTTPSDVVLEINPNLVKNTLIYELAYSKTKKHTAFGEWAIVHGAERVFNGIGMLVEQAVEAFMVWHQRFPNTQPVISLVRGLLGD